MPPQSGHSSLTLGCDSEVTVLVVDKDSMCGRDGGGGGSI